MRIEDTIRQETREAMKNRDEVRLLVLRMLISSLVSKEKEKRYELSKQGKEGRDLEASAQLTDEEVMAVVSSEAKKRRESAAAFEKGGRKELADKEREELKVLEAHLPAQMSEEEIRAEVAKAIGASGALGPQDMGKVMTQLMGSLKGRADGALVSKIVKELLA
ncbi:MAG: GatB/YqeY domain-containing protein [bacterium]|nr:GatB/YqeY domain-containing protein [bacterium]MDZ4231759.1 GatB/YqeY domain-containing protein [Candidatus Pacearchaeota archaeon]